MAQRDPQKVITPVMSGRSLLGTARLIRGSSGQGLLLQLSSSSKIFYNLVYSVDKGDVRMLKGFSWKQTEDFRKDDNVSL